MATVPGSKMPAGLEPLEICITSTPQTLREIILALDLPNSVEDCWLSTSVNCLRFVTADSGEEVLYGSPEWGDLTDCGIAETVPFEISGDAISSVLFAAPADVCGKLYPFYGVKGSSGVFGTDPTNVVVDELPPIEIPLGIDSDVVPTQWCTDDTNEFPVFQCKQTNVEDGSLVQWIPHYFDPATSTLTPYTGASKRCSPVTKSIVQVGTELDLEGCPPVFACISSDQFEDGECLAFDPVLKELVTVSKLGNPAADQIPDTSETIKGRLGAFIADGADETVTRAQLEALIVAQIAARPQTWTDALVRDDAGAAAVTLDAVDHGCVIKLEVSVAACGQMAVPYAAGTPAGAAVVVTEENNAVTTSEGGFYSDGGSFCAMSGDFTVSDGAGFCVDYVVEQSFAGKSGALIEKNA